MISGSSSSAKSDAVVSCEIRPCWSAIEVNNTLAFQGFDARWRLMAYEKRCCLGIINLTVERLLHSCISSMTRFTVVVSNLKVFYYGMWPAVSLRAIRVPRCRRQVPSTRIGRTRYAKRVLGVPANFCSRLFGRFSGLISKKRPLYKAIGKKIR